MNDKRILILNTAIKLFNEHGFHGTSIQMVANAAEMAAGSLYRHFDGKEDLIRRLYHHCISEMMQALMIDHQPQAPLFARYRRFWLNACEGSQRRRDLLIYKELYERSPFFCAEDMTWLLQEWQPLTAFYEEGIRQGLFQPMPVCVLGSLSLGSVFGMTQEHKLNHFALTDELKEQIIQASWKAILVD